MTDNTQHATARNRAAKKAIVLEPKRRKPVWVIFGVAAILAATAALALMLFPGTPADPQTTAGNAAATTVPQGQAIAHAADLFDDGRARHFHYTDAGSDTTITYFVLKSSDGVIRAAFDACDVCWPAGKGYVQDGDEMICRNCGRRFASLRINEVQGGCNPAPLTRALVDGKIVIQVADLLEGRRYFDFSKKG